MAWDGAEHDDAELLRRYLDVDRPQDGRQAAFHTLVDRYHRRVFAVCRASLDNDADAEDAVQETFVKLARGAAGFRGDAQLSTWLYRVARNVCIDHIRRDARRPATPVAEPGELAEAPSTPDTTSATDDTLIVRQALSALDPEARRSLILVAVEGLSYAEAAEVVDLPVGTVKSRVSRARVRLGELLREQDATGAGPGTSHP